jgi:hypothetical protein
VFFQTGQTFLEEAFSPQADDLAARAQARSNLIVAEALGRQQDHFGAHDLKIWQRILRRSFSKLAFLSRGERNLIGTCSRHGIGLLPQYHATNEAFGAIDNTLAYL